MALFSSRFCGLWTALLVVPVLSVGCIGVGDAWIDHPPLQVIGQVQDTAHHPVPHENVAIAVAHYMSESTALKAAYDRKLTTLPPPGNYDPHYYFVYEVETDSNGGFTFSVPERRHFHPFAALGPIVVGMKTSKDIYLILSLVDAEAPIYRVRVHRRRAQAYRLGETAWDFQELSKDGTEGDVSCDVKRSRDEDVVRLTLIEP